VPRAKTRVGNAADLQRRRLAVAVSDYISIVFDDNLSTAARELHVSYDALRKMALGIARRSNLDVLRALAKHSGSSIESWLDSGEVRDATP